MIGPVGRRCRSRNALWREGRARRCSALRAPSGRGASGRSAVRLVVLWRRRAACSALPFSSGCCPSQQVALDRNADGIVVLTGGTSRVSRRARTARLRPRQAAAHHRRQSRHHDRRHRPRSRQLRPLPACCVDLDYSALNTLGNAMQARRWALEHGFHSLIVVTSAYHMPRALAELVAPASRRRSHPVPGRLRSLAHRAVVVERHNDQAGAVGISQISFRQGAHAVRHRCGDSAPSTRAVRAAALNALADRSSVSRSTSILARSILFNVLFYVNLTVHMFVALPTLVLPYPFLRAFIRSYARTSLWLLRVVCGTKVEWRGARENSTDGAASSPANINRCGRHSRSTPCSTIRPTSSSAN